MHRRISEMLKIRYAISDEVETLANSVMEDIKPEFEKVERIVEYNQLKVTAAMIENDLCDFHLTDSTGYGYNDIGRDRIEAIYSHIFRAEDALVRPQIISGTHAITLCLFGILRPGDELLCVTGEPYDTLKDVISGENCGSLKDYNISYSQVDLLDGKPDYDGIRKKINEKTRMVLIQRSRGYSLRPSLDIESIKGLIKYIKGIKEDVICLVDNCYGEFVESSEPTEVGADLCAGSLIKNPGGGITPTGGYVVGKHELIERCAYRLFAPGLGKNCGPSLLFNRLALQGLFYSPMVVGEALKGSIFISRFFEMAGFKVYPAYNEKRSDIVTAIEMGSRELLTSFCRGLQKVGPVDARIVPEPWDMPGYDHQVIMACGSFIQGASIELSADAPIREPYVVYVQGGISFFHVKVGAMKALQNMIDEGIYSLK
ncbi:Aluminum resistance family protein [Thermosediminibacter oceani DSM 16646]|uniref:Aluminum resistance family protein n=2 Tax=Thermosediminibacter TaxID=291988 RepID=D9S3G3_THEOJ|nr:Aluminum resistance family protein [Thermosediminibacter oceani DSM 16646]